MTVTTPAGVRTRSPHSDADEGARREEHQMHTTEQPDALESRLTRLLAGPRPPAVLVQRLAEALTGGTVVLGCADLRSLGFGAYEGQL